jgi:DNA-binding SARP family transcriptional activator
MLALQQGESLAKDVIADRLWEGAPPPSWVGTLEGHISTLRRDIGCTGRSSALATTAKGYVLADDAGVCVDVVEVRRLLQAAAQSDDPRRVALVSSALDLHRGTLLAGNVYSMWAEQARAELATQLVASCTEAARAALRLGDHERAHRIAQHAIEIDECAEGAWQVVLESLERTGRAGEGLTAYGRFRAALLDQVGVEPSPESRAIYARLLARVDGGSSADRAELKVLMRLLRQRLEGWPGIVVPEQDSRLAEVAARILAVA